MFDELHDPTPPPGDLAQLAAVAERAAVRRRRRNAVGGSIAALSLIAVAATATSLNRNGQNDQLFAGSGTDLSTTTTIAPSRTTTAASVPSATPQPDTASDATTSTIAVSPTTTVLPSTSVPLASTVIDTTTTSLVAGDPSEPSDDQWSVSSRDLPQCDGASAVEACPTFATLSDGTLVALVEDLVVVYDQTDSNFRLDLGDVQSDPRVVAVGPDDIGYVSWIPLDVPSDGVPARRVSAIKMAGRDSGQLITTFETWIDPEDVLRPGRRGLVATRCCESRVLFDPVVEPTIPWIDSSGNEIAPPDRRFGIELTDDEMVITGVGDGVSQTWTRPLPEGIDVVPRIFEVADGSAVFVFNPLHSGGTRDVPIHLLPDGSVEVGEAVDGKIEHVLEDGRLIVFDRYASTFSVIDPRAEASIPDPALAPLVAINTDGDAVYVPATSSSLDPVVIFDGPDPDDAPDVGDGPNAVAHVSVAPDESVAYVGLCCSPIVGTVLETRLPEPAAVTSPPVYGAAPVYSPSGAFRVSAGSDGAIAVTDAVDDELLTVVRRLKTQWDTSWDVMWISETRFAILGSLERVWTLSVFDVDAGDQRVTTLFSRNFGLFDESGFDALRFAGQPIAGEIAVHEPGSDSVFSGKLDDFGNNNGDGRGSSLSGITLPGPAQSAWFVDPDLRVWVDTVGTLRIGDLTVPGEYTWARR